VLVESYELKSTKRMSLVEDLCDISPLSKDV
jgi:hypothetical protein